MIALLMFQAAVTTAPHGALRVPEIIISNSRPEPKALPFIVDVDVRAGGQTLWRGPLRVLGGTTSRVRNTKSEPPAKLCDGLRSYGDGDQSGIDIQVQPARYGMDGSERLNVTVRWSRPGITVCPAANSMRVVEMSETIQLDPGQTRTLTGDGELVVVLRRP